MASAQDWGPVREDALAAMGLAWPTMRRLLRELGRRLVESGTLADAAGDGLPYLLGGVLCALTLAATGKRSRIQLASSGAFE